MNKNISTAQHFYDLHRAKPAQFWRVDDLYQSDAMYQRIYENLNAGIYGYVTFKYKRDDKNIYTIVIRRRNSITRMPLTFEWFEPAG